MDYRINEKHSVNGMVLIGNYTGDGQDHPLLATQFLDTFRARTYTVGVDEVWAASSRLVNDFRFGYDRVWTDFVTDDAGRLADGSGLTGGSGYALNTGVTAFRGLPIIYIDFFITTTSPRGTFHTFGSWDNRPNARKICYTDIKHH